MKIHLLLMLILSEASPHPLRWETPPALRNTLLRWETPYCVVKHFSALRDIPCVEKYSPALRNTPFALRNTPLHWETLPLRRKTPCVAKHPILRNAPLRWDPSPHPPALSNTTCVEQYYPALRNNPCVEKHSSALRNTTPRWETPLCVEKHSLCVEKYSLALRNTLHPALRNAYVSDTIKVFMTLTRHIFVIKFFRAFILCKVRKVMINISH